MRVHVVMGNDYPEKVFEHAQHAARFVRMKTGQERGKSDTHSPRIHWRSYEFELEKNDAT